MLKVYSQLVYNNLLANHRILTAAQQLLPGEFEADGVSFSRLLGKHSITVSLLIGTMFMLLKVEHLAQKRGKLMSHF